MSGAHKQTAKCTSGGNYGICNGQATGERESD